MLPYDYWTGFVVAWLCRGMLAFSLVAILAMSGGCSHVLKLTADSAGSITKEPAAPPLGN